MPCGLVEWDAVRSRDNGIPWVWAIRPVRSARTMIIKYTNLVNNTGIPGPRAATTWHTYMQNVQEVRGGGMCRTCRGPGDAGPGHPDPSNPTRLCCLTVPYSAYYFPNIKTLLITFFTVYKELPYKPPTHPQQLSNRNRRFPHIFMSNIYISGLP